MVQKLIAERARWRVSGMGYPVSHYDKVVIQGRSAIRFELRAFCKGIINTFLGMFVSYHSLYGSKADCGKSSLAGVGYGVSGFTL